MRNLNWAGDIKTWIAAGALTSAMVAGCEGYSSGTAPDSEAKADLVTITSALKSFKQDCGRYPTTEEGLSALMKAPPAVMVRWQGPYMDQPIPLDPYGQPFAYRRLKGKLSDSYTLASPRTETVVAKTDGTMGE